MPPRDLCKGCRECYSAVLKAVVMSPWVAGVCMGIPTYYLLSGLLFDGSTMFFYPEFTAVRSNITAPYYTLLALTVAAWLIELAAIRWNLPNLLGLCAFCHSAVGSWWLVNFVIIGFAGWSYLPLRLMGIILIAIMIPAVIWHITGDIINAYMKKVLEEIALVSRGLAAAGQAFEITEDLEMGRVGQPKI